MKPFTAASGIKIPTQISTAPVETAKPRRKKSPAVSGQFYAAVEQMVGEVSKAGEKPEVRYLPVSCPLKNSAQVKAWIKANGQAGETYIILILSRRVSLSERTVRKISEVS